MTSDRASEGPRVQASQAGPISERKSFQLHDRSKGPREPKSYNQKESTIPGVPTLECPNGIVNIESEYNFINFSDAIANYVELTYGDVARIFRTGDYPKYERKKYNAAEYTEDADPLGLKRDMLR